MSTSLLYHGLGIRGIVYQRTEYEENTIRLWIKPQRDRLACATCGSRKVTLRGKKIRSFRSVPIGRKSVEIIYPVHRLQCHHCGGLRQEKIPFADPHQRHTRSFGRYVLDFCRCMSVKDMAEHLQVHWDVVKTIQKRYLKRHFSHPPLKASPADCN